MDYKLLITDLDGPMLSSNAEISRKNLEAVRELQKRGKHIAVASGRLYVDAVRYARELGCADHYNIANSGATVFTDGKEEVVARFDDRFYRRVVDILRYNEFPFIVLAKGYDGAFYDKSSEIYVKRVREINPDTTMEFMETDVRELTNVYKVVSSYTNVDHIIFHRELERLHHQLRAEISGEYFMELFPRGVSKWSGALRLAEEMGISPREIVAVGDQENDMAIVRNVGLGIAMKNAVPRLKNLADEVLDYTNDEDGLYHLIHEYLL